MSRIIHPAVIEQKRREREDREYAQNRIQPSLRIPLPVRKPGSLPAPTRQGESDFTVDHSIDFSI